MDMLGTCIQSGCITAALMQPLGLLAGADSLDGRPLFQAYPWPSSTNANHAIQLRADSTTANILAWRPDDRSSETHPTAKHQVNAGPLKLLGGIGRNVTVKGAEDVVVRMDELH